MANKYGKSYLWFDNWTSTGDLCTIIQGSGEWDKLYKCVIVIVKDGSWKEN